MIDLFGKEIPKPGAPPFQERWSNRRAFKIGVMVGQGLSVPAICAELGDGVPETLIARMISEWGVKSIGKQTHRPVKVMLSGKHRTMIYTEAKARETDMSELIRRIAVQVAQDRLYAAILDR